MAKIPDGNGPRRARRQIPPQSRLKLFRPISWRGGVIASSTDEYVSHLLIELGRLGMEIRDIEDHARPPNTRTVLSDLLQWLSDRPGKAYAELINWQTLDFPQMRSRLEEDRYAKPRIELSAEITKMNNLSVRWHPAGWRDSEFDWRRPDHHYSNLITHRKWQQPPDFHWFVGDEQPTFDSRPSNELMYVRGVGNLRPAPREEYGPYASYNRDIVDSILICAVRSAYETLLSQLEYSFDVTLIHAFDFVTRDEGDENDPWSARYPIRRVISWTIEDAVDLYARRDQEASLAKEHADRAKLENVATAYGFTLETFVGALLRASSVKRTGPAPSGEHLNRNAAKELRNAGFKIHAGEVRDIRELIERHRIEVLPEFLRPEVSEAPIPPNNIVRFPQDSE
ncbi:MAG: hypothetical protein EOQ86_14610 [Mesorhizobium sp.]|uniref:hypothetical protein n=1 Tax=Mesorhizobium sp. TaxID=1871066 RepID=UPI000FE98E18|nr:hypothetical protein [Mesorhizobium sp.]RWH79135.1 MAG: hypothetical protein EOQ85_12960 [Mesorhizobium sp.]RWH81664.1 MAG: hypothetical protein EOQ86_14610 [Mesorhizobium sp.]RWH86569.1 MAG: hypothetical protein EOQ87_27200 [Mesorhizobium sp.]RWI01746.1 MAG: hypothetical protein EOQ88_04920 [Mesorhizobium sp.]RWI02193.1 MAG: hypothetical protein EOQ89_16125 [Mesorhizobium sp.]